MRFHNDILTITVKDFKQLRKLLKIWGLSDSDLYKEFELLSLRGHYDSDYIIYNWKKGNVQIWRKGSNFNG